MKALLISLVSAFKIDLITKDNLEPVVDNTEGRELLQIDADDAVGLELTNMMNNQYLGKLFIGKQPAWLSFDTGSNWLTVSSGSKKAYMPSMSLTARPISQEMVSEHYGSTDLSGEVWRDQVCLSKDTRNCVENFPIIAFRN